jgi:hypothetical protein
LLKAFFFILLLPISLLAKSLGFNGINLLKNPQKHVLYIIRDFGEKEGVVQIAIELSSINCGRAEYVRCAGSDSAAPSNKWRRSFVLPIPGVRARRNAGADNCLHSL